MFICVFVDDKVFSCLTPSLIRWRSSQGRDAWVWSMGGRRRVDGTNLKRMIIGNLGVQFNIPLAISGSDERKH
eukprot:gene9915-biopygen15360